MVWHCEGKKRYAHITSFLWITMSSMLSHCNFRKPEYFNASISHTVSEHRHTYAIFLVLAHESDLSTAFKYINTHTKEIKMRRLAKTTVQL